MDSRTLRLATIQLTEPLLEQYLAYERALVAELDRTQGELDWNGRFAFAHTHALNAANLDVLTYEKVRAVVGDWSSRQGAIETVRRRLDAARANVGRASERGIELDQRDRRIIEQAERELPGLESSSDLERRYGKEAIELLERYHERLLASHREVAHREGCGRL